MNIIIPLGGKGERFLKQGFTVPKPLIRIFDKCMIDYVLDKIAHSLHPTDNVFIIYNLTLDLHDFSGHINRKYPHIRLIQIGDTRGATETLKIGIDSIFAHNMTTNKKCLLLDCDAFYNQDIVSVFRETIFSTVFYTINTTPNPIFSYIELDAGSNIIHIKEKQKISDNANTGAYGFADINTLHHYCKYVLDHNITANNEPYTSCVISEMIRNGVTFKGFELNASDVVSLGTPTDVEKYINNTNILLFDLDGTLVKTDDIYIAVWNDLLSKFNIPCSKTLFDNCIKGKNDSTFLKYINSEITESEIEHISKEKDDLFISKLMQIQSNTSILIDGVLSFFEKIKQHKIAIVTSSNRRSCNYILEKTGLIRYVDVIIASEDCTHHKPDPEPYLNAMKRFHGDKSRTFIFEDSYSGYCSAKRTEIDNICLIVNDESCIEIKKTVEFKARDYTNITLDDISEFQSIHKQSNPYLTQILEIMNVGLPIKNITRNTEYLKTGYICDIIGYTVEYDDGSSKNIILKISNLDNELSNVAQKLDMYKNELYFYSNISHLIDNVPLYMGSFNRDNKDAVILENLNCYNGKFNINLNQKMNVLLNVVKCAFNMHSKFHFTSEQDVIPVFKNLRKINEIGYYKDLIHERFDLFCKNTFPILTATEQNILLHIFQNLDKIYDDVSEFPLSFCHGDLKSPNIFYKNEFEPVFLDWQYIHLNKGVSDIVFLLVESVDFDPITVEIVLNYYYTLHYEKFQISYKIFMQDFKNALMVFPFFVCVWFNSEDYDKLIDPGFPRHFLRNLMKYYNKYLVSILHDQ